MLCETCEVAPELYEDKVIELLELGVSDDVFAEKCLPVLLGAFRDFIGLALHPESSKFHQVFPCGADTGAPHSSSPQ